MSTAYRISDAVPGRTMEFRKRVLHPRRGDRAAPDRRTTRSITCCRARARCSRAPTSGGCAGRRRICTRATWGSGSWARRRCADHVVSGGEAPRLSGRHRRCDLKHVRAGRRGPPRRARRSPDRLIALGERRRARVVATSDRTRSGAVTSPAGCRARARTVRAASGAGRSRRGAGVEDHRRARRAGRSAASAVRRRLGRRCGEGDEARPASPRDAARASAPVPVCEPGASSVPNDERDVHRVEGAARGLGARGEVDLIDPGRRAGPRARLRLDHLPAPAAPGGGGGVEDLGAAPVGKSRGDIARRPIRGGCRSRSSGAMRPARLSQSGPHLVRIGGDEGAGLVDACCRGSSGSRCRLRIGVGPERVARRASACRAPARNRRRRRGSGRSRRAPRPAARPAWSAAATGRVGRPQLRRDRRACARSR